MNLRFAYWASMLIISLIVMGIAIRILALHNVALSESLIVRGGSCLLLTLLFAYKKQLSLRPKAVKTQCIRALIAGLALTLFSLSYNWLTASAVSVLSNIDVPLLIVLGPLVGVKASQRTRLLSLASIAFLIWYVLGLETQVQLFYGLTSLMTACLLLCAGYLFIKKSMEEENQAITILVPSLAIIFYGLIEKIAINLPAASWTPTLLLIAILSGIGMFVAYLATMALYEITDLAQAEFPTLIASVMIQPVETVFLNVALQTMYLVPSIGFVIAIYFVLRLQQKTPEIIYAN